MIKLIDTYKPVFRSVVKVAFLTTLLFLPVACGGETASNPSLSPTPAPAPTRAVEKTCVLSESGDTVLGIMAKNNLGENTLVDIDQGNNGSFDVQNLAAVLAPGLQYNKTPAALIQDKVCFWK